MMIIRRLIKQLEEEQQKNYNIITRVGISKTSEKEDTTHET